MRNEHEAAPLPADRFLKEQIDAANNILLAGMKCGRDIEKMEAAPLLRRARNLLEWARLVTTDHEGSDARLRETIAAIDAHLAKVSA